MYSYYDIMEENRMTQPMKQALISLVIWGFVTAAFIPIFFSRGGPATYAQDKPRFVFVAALFGIGYIAYFTMLFLTRAKTRKDTVVKDERDEYISRRSCGAALIFVLCFVFILCITLYELYRETGCVPVGWMWFLGYMSIFWAYITHSAVALVFHSRMSGHGET